MFWQGNGGPAPRNLEVEGTRTSDPWHTYAVNASLLQPLRVGAKANISLLHECWSGVVLRECLIESERTHAFSPNDNTHHRYQFKKRRSANMMDQTQSSSSRDPSHDLEARTLAKARFLYARTLTTNDGISATPRER
jgi:hypothetical protein